MTHRRTQIECVALAVCIVGTLLLPNITTPVKASRGLTVTLQTEEDQILPLYSDSFALVIGASQYTQGWPDLPGVINDVQHIQSALSDHGFRVKTVIDPDSGRLRDAIEAFIIRNGNQVNQRHLENLTRQNLGTRCGEGMPPCTHSRHRSGVTAKT